MNDVAYLEVLRALLPEAVLTLTALVVLALDLSWGRHRAVPSRMRLAGWVSAAGCAVALGVIFGLSWPAEWKVPLVEISARILHYKAALLALTLAVALLAADTDFTPHAGEYFALVLLATVGLLLLVSANNLLLLFVALELASLSLYLLTALDKRQPRSAEAGLKYFLFGSVAAACLLFGFSLLYGLSGEFYLQEIAARMPRGPLVLDPILVLALALVVGGLAFKIAAVPFHLWAPDAYEGAPAPSAALVASGSKVASFLVLNGVVAVVFGPLGGNAHWGHFAAGWKPLLALLAALSMVLGNLAALGQSNVRRLLAYSAIAHSGYALLAIVTRQELALAYYVITYGLAIVGAFGVVAVVEKQTGGAALEDFQGLARRSPVLAGALMVFLLSLAGIPPLAGFFGKFYVFLEALREPAGAGGRPSLGLLYLVILAIGMSAVSLYYYLQVLKYAYRGDAEESAAPWRASLGTWVISALALAVIWLGCFPEWLLRYFR
ncbi:NADH-quinone oxidoreductase subunit N [Fontisphaera persica]|uniref:NADH-quinone oxidoreductase subunit N n=1 Tax=Fontisphaera persica TaxID=2974023 RepID=UPI0024BFC659|nr:NADH-quinone oxidoreductase subunit N [Fontisphaera persica]WCJ59295.1 NADH-quinone oxidoreductase subunit N [Fontisphaera persica]